ncbi:MAG: hypothetical protein IT208_13410 [Chthonomonadales bacterium]|nr:hypothetical protein [Chthonomonadales bacterium]
MRFPYVVAALVVAGLPMAARCEAAPAPAPFAYRWSPGSVLRYRLVASIKGHLPLFGSPDPVDLEAVVRVVYRAVPLRRGADGHMEVTFKAESAEAEVATIPISIPPEDIDRILNQTVTLASTGEVKSVRGGAPLPFGLSVPGVDPQRLYTLLVPIVFPTEPVRPGDSWQFDSELLGGEGAPATFRATVLSPERGKAPGAGARAPRVREQFRMEVDQRLDVDRRPVAQDADPYRKRTGRIEGDGVFVFDRALGRLHTGRIRITADLLENLIGAPRTPEEPREVASRIDATVTVQLLPPAKARPQPVPTSRKETR